MNNNNNKIFFLLMFIFVVLLLKYTGGFIIQFLVGIGICLILESCLIILYCLGKVLKAYRESNRMILKHNQNLNPEQDYKFQQRIAKTDFFLNKYTQQAKVSKKKNSLKFTSLQQYYFQQASISQQSRIQTIRFLGQIKGYYKILNLFNNTLINFGKSLSKLPNSSIFSNFEFINCQQFSPSRIQKQQLIQIQKRILENYQFKNQSQINNQSNIWFDLPSWNTFIKCLQFIGLQFKKIQQMRDSNSQMLQMIHKRLLQDYQFIQKQIIQLGKSIQQTRSNIQNLKKQKQIYQTDQQTGDRQAHIDMIYWLKKQYYKFTDMQLRIKQNQSKFKQQTQKIKYYKQRLTMFLNQNKKKYLKILKTRFIAFLDSYFITIDQSIQQFKKILIIKHYYKDIKPSKVNKIISTKNINLIIQSQIKYYYQYQNRIKFYSDKLNIYFNGIKSLSIFLLKIKNVFQDLDNNLLDCLQYQDKQIQYFKRFFKTLRIQSKRILLELILLYQINQKVLISNTKPINLIQQNLTKTLQKTQKLLNYLSLQNQPLHNKYRQNKSQIDSSYKFLQEQIILICTFQALYYKHTNRIKKILIVSLMSFLNFQKKYLNFGRINDKIDTDYDIAQQKFHTQQNKDLLETFEVGVQDTPGLDTGNYLSVEYVGVINRFLFAAFNQWKTSSFFRETILHELYILFNLQPNQGLDQIHTDNLILSGLPPQVVWIKQLRAQQNQFFVDINLAFKGRLQLHIKSNYNFLGYQVPVKVNFQVEELYCVLRVCFISSDLGQGWFSFIGQPIAKFNVIPNLFHQYNIDIKIITRMFQNIILRKMKQATYPIRQKLPIPMSKKNQDLEIIGKRLQNRKKQRQGI